MILARPVSLDALEPLARWERLARLEELELPAQVALRETLVLLVSRVNKETRARLV